VEGVRHTGTTTTTTVLQPRREPLDFMAQEKINRVVEYAVYNFSALFIIVAHSCFSESNFILCIFFLLFMVTLWNRADHYIFALWFILSSSFFFFLA